MKENIQQERTRICQRNRKDLERCKITKDKRIFYNMTKYCEMVIDNRVGQVIADLQENSFSRIIGVDAKLQLREYVNSWVVEETIYQVPFQEACLLRSGTSMVI